MLFIHFSLSYQPGTYKASGQTSLICKYLVRVPLHQTLSRCLPFLQSYLTLTTFSDLQHIFYVYRERNRLSFKRRVEFG